MAVSVFCRSVSTEKFFKAEDYKNPPPAVGPCHLLFSERDISRTGKALANALQKTFRGFTCFYVL